MHDMHGESLCSDYFQRQASSLIGERRIDEGRGGGTKGSRGWVCVTEHEMGDREAHRGVDRRRRCCVGCNERGEGARG